MSAMLEEVTPQPKTNLLRSRAVRLVTIATGFLLVAVVGLKLLFPAGHISSGTAIARASATTGVHRVDRSAAKLMQWKEFQAASGWTPGVCCFSTPEDSQLVWVVALVGDIRDVVDPTTPHEMGEIVVLDAGSAGVIAFDGGGTASDCPPGPFACRPAWPANWPPYWDLLPDRSHT
jgi:hypothetical protein